LNISRVKCDSCLVKLGDYHSHGSPIGRGLTTEYAYAPPPYTNIINALPPYTSGIHAPPPYVSRILSRHEPLYANRTHEPPYISRMHEPHAYASGSYHSPRSDLVILCFTSFVCTFTNIFTTWKMFYMNYFYDDCIYIGTSCGVCTTYPPCSSH
jgi:hypothetical protein